MNEDYLKQSQQMKVGATKFLEDHKVIEILKEFGEPYFFGSYELDLMNRKDIDIVLVVKKLSFEVLANLAKKLNEKGFNKYWIFDNSDKGCQEDPKHIVCEVGYGFYHHLVKVEDRWEIGISVCEKDELENALKLTREVADKLKQEPELKELIVKLKFQLAEKHGEHKYRGKAVYDAVLKHNAQTIEEIENLDINNY